MLMAFSVSIFFQTFFSDIVHPNWPHLVFCLTQPRVECPDWEKLAPSTCEVFCDPSVSWHVERANCQQLARSHFCIQSMIKKRRGKKWLSGCFNCSQKKRFCPVQSKNATCFFLDCLFTPLIEHSTKAVLKGQTLWSLIENGDLYELECLTCGEPCTFCLSLHVKRANCHQLAHLICIKKK